MNAINRIGQKVICVIRMVAQYEDGVCSSEGVPQVNCAYTVSGFVSAPTQLAPGIVMHSPGITLTEVDSPECSCCGARMGWPIQAFRPVNERKTDIGDLVRLGQDVRESEDA